MKQQKEKSNKKSLLRNFFLDEKNLTRDAIIVALALLLAVLLTLGYRQSSLKHNQEVLSSQPAVENPVKQESEIESNTEVEAEIENEAENPTIDTTNWKIYKNQWYGFELKYPNEWNKPLLKGAVSGAKWEYRYQFRKTETDENNPYIGFDVVVYNVSKVKELSSTDEFPTVKSEELKESGLCEEIEGHLAENEEYPAEQIYIPFDDECHNSAYFYTLTRDQYIYNIVPILAGEEEKNIQTEIEITQNLPEFISASSTFNLIDIVRPKPAPPAPKITAPKPVATTKRDAQGRMVCAKKNDKPAKSKQNKGKHLDMECCLDPDEYPNPWCYYPPEKYGKLLDKLDK